MNELAAKLGYEFRDPGLLLLALTHRSYLNENRSQSEHNERLEFLGDAVLELAVTEHLFRAFPDRPEGELTAWRSSLVKGERLAAVARDLQLGENLRLSRGEERSGGRSKGYLLANAFEAVIGAIYLDGGFEPARDFIGRQLLPLLAGILESGEHIDAKSRLQELAQEKLAITPTYKVMAEIGPDHAKVFTMAAYFGRDEIARGDGASKQAAEQAAARAALARQGWK